MRRRFTGNHDDDPRFDRYDEQPWSSIPCHCGARYRCAAWGEPARHQCEACGEAELRESEMIDAVDRNAERIRGYNGEYGVPAGPDEDDV